MTPVLPRTLARERRSIVGWLIGIVAIVLVTAGSWPAIEASAADFEQVLASLPDALTAFFGEGIADFSAAGIVGSRLYGTIGLALFLAYAISRGARGIAGEEEQGTLELLVVQPISRTAIAADKVAAMLVGLLVLVTVEAVLLLAMMPAVGLDFPLANVLGASAGMFLLSAMFGSLAFAIGAATGRRGLAVGVAGGVAGALFILTGLSGLVDALEPVADISPFARYDGTTVLAQGLEVGPAIAFAVVGALLVAGGILRFRTRDLR